MQNIQEKMKHNKPIHKEENEADTKWRKMFHAGALEAPPSPWFTQNVLHRLPERKRRVASLIEYALYIIGIIVTCAYTVTYVMNTIKSNVITVNNVIVYAMLVALLISLCYMAVVPFARRSAQGGNVL